MYISCTAVELHVGEGWFAFEVRYSAPELNMDSNALNKMCWINEWLFMVSYFLQSQKAS